MTKSRRVHLLLGGFFASLLLFSFGVSAVSAQEQDARLDFEHIEATNDEISMAVTVDTADRSVNWIVADFLYPSDILAVQDVEVTESPFAEFFTVDYETPGVVRLKYVSNETVAGDGTFAVVRFGVVGSGRAEINFTEDVMVGLQVPLVDTQLDYLGESSSAVYTIDDDLGVLPETGTTEDVATIAGIIILILLLMIVIFAFSSFTIWGGVYLSLGKWEGRFSIGAEKDSKEDKITAKKKGGDKKQLKSSSPRKDFKPKKQKKSTKKAAKPKKDKKKSSSKKKTMKGGRKKKK